MKDQQNGVKDSRDREGPQREGAVLDRRRFLKSLTAGGVAACSTVDLKLARQTTPFSLAPGCQVFTLEQAATVEAICEQIVPADDYPGAKEAGVLYYIDRMLAGDLARFRPQYAEGLTMVDLVSQGRYRRNFSALSWEQQTAVLQDLAAGEAGGAAGQAFFSLIRQDTMDAYYGSPQYGGNRNGVSWKMIDFQG
jgi:gluconate 2-dehydrogenase gamma chain